MSVEIESSESSLDGAQQAGVSPDFVSGGYLEASSRHHPDSIRLKESVGVVAVLLPDSVVGGMKLNSTGCYGSAGVCGVCGVGLSIEDDRAGACPLCGSDTLFRGAVARRKSLMECGTNIMGIERCVGTPAVGVGCDFARFRTVRCGDKKLCPSCSGGYYLEMQERFLDLVREISSASSLRGFSVRDLGLTRFVVSSVSEKSRNLCVTMHDVRELRQAVKRALEGWLTIDWTAFSHREQLKHMRDGLDSGGVSWAFVMVFHSMSTVLPWLFHPHFEVFVFNFGITKAPDKMGKRHVVYRRLWTTEAELQGLKKGLVREMAPLGYRWTGSLPVVNVGYVGGRGKQRLVDSELSESWGVLLHRVRYGFRALSQDFMPADVSPVKEQPDDIISNTLLDADGAVVDDGGVLAAMMRGEDFDAAGMRVLVVRRDGSFESVPWKTWICGYLRACMHPSVWGGKRQDRIWYCGCLHSSQKRAAFDVLDADFEALEERRRERARRRRLCPDCGGSLEFMPPSEVVKLCREWGDGELDKPPPTLMLWWESAGFGRYVRTPDNATLNCFRLQKSGVLAKRLPAAGGAPAAG